jgi:ADP-ribose pyrophosphatase YjhB (NUDIX family)
MTPAYRFCPVCAGALESRVVKAGERARLVCTACGYVLYLDPKVAVGTIIAAGTSTVALPHASAGGSGEGVVLVRRAIEPGIGLWVFPGGYVDRGETPQVAAVREAREECGLDIRLDGLINLYAYPDRVPIIIVYAATVTGGTLCVDEECTEARLFGRDEIPWRELAFPSTREALRDYFAGVRHPGR